LKFAPCPVFGIMVQGEVVSRVRELSLASY